MTVSNARHVLLLYSFMIELMNYHFSIIAQLGSGRYLQGLFRIITLIQVASIIVSIPTLNKVLFLNDVIYVVFEQVYL